MPENRHVPAKTLIDMILAKGIIEMVVAANNMGNAHIMVIHHHRQHIGRAAITAQQDHIIELVMANSDTPLNHILYHCLACFRHF